MVELLENYIDSKKTENDNQQSEGDFEIRKNYISNLFLLSKSKSSKNKKFEEVSKIVLPILIMRCKQILEDFIKEEKS